MLLRCVTARLHASMHVHMLQMHVHGWCTRHCCLGAAAGADRAPPAATGAWHDMQRLFQAPQRPLLREQSRSLAVI